MKYLLLSLPLALMACVKPDCVVYVNGKPVYDQCYQNDSKGGGNTYSPPTADDNGGDSNDESVDNGDKSNDSGNDSNGGKSKDRSNDSNGDKSNDHSDDSNGGNSDEDDN